MKRERERGRGREREREVEREGGILSTGRETRSEDQITLKTKELKEKNNSPVLKKDNGQVTITGHQRGKEKRKTNHSNNIRRNSATRNIPHI